MKRLLLLLFFVFHLLTSHAQSPIITQRDLLKVNDIFVFHYDSLYVINPSASGENQTWDYSNIKDHHQDTVYTIPVSETKYKDVFASSSFAFGPPNSDPDYVTINSTGWYDDNFSTLHTFSSNIHPTEVYEINIPYSGTKPRLLSLPASYGATWKDTASIDLKIPGQTSNYFDTLRKVEVQIRSGYCDAWGSLQLPGASYSKALRVKEIVNYSSRTDTKKNGVWTVGTTNSDFDTLFQFWVNDGKVPILGFYKLFQSWYSPVYVSSLISSISERSWSNERVFAYPNPAKESLTVYGATKIISLVSLEGEELAFNSTTVNNGQQVVFGTLPKGLYLLKVQKGETTKVLKITIFE
jgi:hypothetical protein